MADSNRQSILHPPPPPLLHHHRLECHRHPLQGIGAGPGAGTVFDS